jgi:ABC-type anion transport system duplicated permease subunit
VPSSITTTFLAGAIALALAGTAIIGIVVLVFAALIWEIVVSWPAK